MIIGPGAIALGLITVIAALIDAAMDVRIGPEVRPRAWIGAVVGILILCGGYWATWSGINR